MMNLLMKKMGMKMIIENIPTQKKIENLFEDLSLIDCDDVFHITLDLWRFFNSDSIHFDCFIHYTHPIVEGENPCILHSYVFNSSEFGVLSKGKKNVYAEIQRIYGKMNRINVNEFGDVVIQWSIDK